MPATGCTKQFRGQGVSGRACQALPSACAAEIMKDVLLSAKLDDQARFKQMVLETRAGLEAAMVGSGHAIAASRLDGQVRARATSLHVALSLSKGDIVHNIQC